jgi:hypothetical protein
MAMHALAVEYQEILNRYFKLTEVLKQIFGVDEAGDPQALIRSIVENQDWLMEIRQLDSRVLELSKRLERCREELGSADCEQIEGFSNTVNAQALHIRELCRLQEQRVQSRREQLAKELREIGNGTRYLKVIKPTKTNFPKFIDSTG